jgi:hypothetical protein
MIAAILALVYGLVMFMLAGEAQTPVLRVLGFCLATFITIIGALAGWTAARDQ